MVVDIPKLAPPTAAATIQPGPWWRWDDLAAGGPRVEVKAPCGHIGLLDHEVQPDGTVTPSLDCPRCSFHDHVRLLEWR